MSDPIALVPGKPDAEVAAEIKARFEEKLTELCKMLDDAEKAGFNVNFGTGKGPLGKWMLTGLIVAKHY